MRPLLLACLLSLAAGCATTGDPSIPRKSLHVRVISSAEIGVFEGDVELSWYSHLVQSVDDPQVTFRIMADRDDCPRPDSHATYRVEVEKRRFQTRHLSPENRALIPNLLAVSCQAD
jgi:hypothetical protein